MRSDHGPRAGERTRAVLYWATTGLLATEGIVGGVMGALRMAPFSEIIAHLGYPPYFMTLHGVSYALGGVALLIPRLPLLKEWAYAGLFFNYTGAITSHLAVGDGASSIVGPIVFLALVVTSWALRPVSRRTAKAPRSGGAPIGRPGEGGQ